MKAVAGSFDEYLDGVSADKRTALERLRKIIHAVAPQAEECISYGLAAFRLNGKPLVALGATNTHCAFYPMSGNTVAAHRKELKEYETSKGTIRFQADTPLPATLVRKLVKARIAENGKQQRKSRRARDAAGKGVLGGAQAAPAVVAFLRALDHPMKKEIEAVRKIILGVSPEIREGIKWNAPSFRTSDYFATFFLHSRDRVQLIFHRGAKVKDNSTRRIQFPDPAGLIQWLANERCRVTLGAGREITTNRAALEKFVRDWIRQR